MVQYLFYGFAFLSILFALLMLFTKSPVHSVLYLILTFFIIACQYILLNAQFLAVVHLIVYAGAIMVLFLFVLMLLNLNKDNEPQKSLAVKVAATITSGSLLLIMVGALKSVQQIKVLFTDYVVPFEISAILFLAAMVGAVLVGKRNNTKYINR